MLRGSVCSVSDSLGDSSSKASASNWRGAAKSVLWGWIMVPAYVFLKNLRVKQGLT